MRRTIAAFFEENQGQKFFDENVYKKTYNCGSKPPTIYGLPKTQKLLFDTDDSLLDQLLLPWALITTILLSFSINIFIQLSQKSIVLAICLVLMKKYNR